MAPTAELVETHAGRLRGRARRGVCTFAGVPYAADTGGRHRFQRARRFHWSGVLEADGYGDSAPQDHAGASGAPAHLAWVLDIQSHSESCLVLNIFTPNVDTGAQLPVMIYLHGGGFVYGSASATGLDGANLASRGVVVVTLNHRLNLFGHLFLGDGADDRYLDSGNVGLLDIVEALRWVRESISVFGGDPDRVTLFGQSGGGSKVGALMAMPEAAGLFHAAIMQSASSALRVATLEEASRNTKAFLRELGVPAGRLDALHELPPERLLTAMRRAIVAAGHVDNFRPVVDGRSLLSQPFSGDTSRQPNDVPLIIGWCETELRLAFSRDPTQFERTMPEATTQLARWLAVSESAAAEVMDIYRSQRPDDSPGDLLALIYGDHMYRRTATEIAERRAKSSRANTFVYLLDWRTPVLDGLLRSPHTLCLPFVLGNVDLARGITGDGEDRHRLQDEMSGAWAEFAKRGNPNHPGLPRWAPFSLADRATMILGGDSRCQRDPGRAERIALERVPPYVPSLGEGARRP
jgi:para-nitrobenzyl esterase